MKERLKSIWRTLKRPRYAILTIIALIIIIIIVVKVAGGKKSAYQTEAVSLGNVVQEVDATGDVKPADAADLGFAASGKVATINVKVGDEVKAGDVLMTLSNTDVSANLNSAQAKLTTLLNGARPEDLAVSASGVSSAQAGVTTAGASLTNTITTTFVQVEDAIQNHIDKLYTNPTVSPTFGTTITGSDGTIYSISAPNLTTAGRLNAERSTVQGILNSWATVSTNQNIGDTASTTLSQVQIVQNFVSDVAGVVNILTSPYTGSNSVYLTYKTEVSTARTNVDAALVSLQAAIQGYVSAQSALDVAEKQQTLKEAPATSEDVQVQEAAVQVAQAAYDNTVITAPFDGLITNVQPEVGEIVSPNSPVVSMISGNNLEVEVDIPEADIAKVKIGAGADITFDAFNNDLIATATVTTIDPAATVIEGVPTYHTVLNFSELDPRIKSGMTANIVIHGDQRDNVIAVPQRAIVTTNGTDYLETVQAGKIVNVPVTTGLRGSDGTIEITGGVNEGELFIPSPAAAQ